MFVSETSLFSSSTMKVRICSMEGVDIMLDVSPDMTVDKLKVLAVSHLHDPTDSAKTSLYHKLVQVSTSKVLTEDRTLIQELVRENDELLLLRKRIPPPAGFDPQTSKPKEEMPKRHTISMEQIKKATQHIPAAKANKETYEPASAVDFQAELKKILVSLIEAAQKILCLNPEAAEMFKEAQEYIAEQTTGPAVDKLALKQLTDMGFPENKSIKALKSNGNSPTQSIQWLLDHIDDPDAEPECNPSETDDKTGSNQNAQLVEETNEEETTAALGPRKVANMLESFRAFRRKQFKPNPRALRNLTEMGFDQADVVDALRVSSNKESDACEWLLSGNRAAVDRDLEEGLDEESPIYKAIMSNHIVQLGLNNPRSLLAFLHMLENPSNTQQWLSDQDIGPMLLQISRIYHAERHTQKSTNNSQDLRSAVANSTYGATGLSAHALGVPHSPHSGSSSSSYSSSSRFSSGSSDSNRRGSRSSSDSSRSPETSSSSHSHSPKKS